MKIRKNKMKKVSWKALVLVLMLLFNMTGMVHAAETTGTWSLKIENGNYPTSIVKGESFAQKGKISSNYKIKNIFLAVYDAEGELVESWLRTDLNTYQYEFGKMNIDFTKISSGKNYRYVLAVRDEAGKRNLIDVRFDVKAPSTLKITNSNYPAELTEGNAFQSAGVVSSNYLIKNVYILVQDEAGNTRVEYLKTNVNAYTYDLSKTKIDFTKLPVGKNYRYVLAVRDEINKKNLLDCRFDVNAKIDPYTEKVNAFLSDSRWTNGAEWAAAKKPIISTYGSSGCCAYAADFVKYVFLQNSLANGTKYINPSEIRSGDVIHVQNTSHWVVVLYRNGNQLITAEGNWSSKVVVSSTAYTVNGNTLMRDGKVFRVFVKGYHYQ